MLGGAALIVTSLNGVTRDGTAAAGLLVPSNALIKNGGQQRTHHIQKLKGEAAATCGAAWFKVSEIATKKYTDGAKAASTSSDFSPSDDDKRIGQAGK